MQMLQVYNCCTVHTHPPYHNCFCHLKLPVLIKQHLADVLCCKSLSVNGSSQHDRICVSDDHKALLIYGVSRSYQFIACKRVSVADAGVSVRLGLF